MSNDEFEEKNYFLIKEQKNELKSNQCYETKISQ
jgi:hypothetical protein